MMPITVPNPYSGKDEETCSVSFAAQQQMAGGVGSPQTEAEYHKSKQLGEWGVILGKLNKGDIPNGTKVLTYENTVVGSRGYLYAKGGKLHKRSYFPDGKQTDGPVPNTLGENIISSSVSKSSIPQAVSVKPKPEGIPFTQQEIFNVTKNNSNIPVGNKIAISAAGHYITINEEGLYVEYGPAVDGFGFVPVDTKHSLKLLMSHGEWFKPKVIPATPAAPIKTKTTFPKDVNVGDVILSNDSTWDKVHSVTLVGSKTYFLNEEDKVIASAGPHGHVTAKVKDATQGSPAKTVPATTTPPAAPTQVAAPTPAPPVNPGSTSPGSMSNEDVSALFVKVKDDLAKEKGLNIKGTNPALDEEVYKAIGAATGYTSAEVKAKIDAYKADGNKLSALKKKVLAGTKKVPSTTQIAKDPPPSGSPPVSAVSQVIPEAEGSVSKQQALKNLEALGEEGNGYVSGGTTALGFQKNEIGVNKLGAEASKKFDEPLNIGLAELAKKHGVQEMVDTSTTDLYTNQTWLFSKVVKKYVNNPGDNAVLAVRKDGKIIVVDGNHRAAAAKLTNGKVKMVILDLDSNTAPATGPDPKPNGVPTVATPAVANQIKVEVKQEAEANPIKVYSDEDVVAAYIIAKDEIVAASGGKWTLYTKNDQMDIEISDKVGAKTGLNPNQQKHAMANYLASGKKVSVLKKQLIKQGTLKPQADSLKKTKEQKSQEQKAEEVEQKADEGYTPTPTPATGTPPTDTGKPAPKRVQSEAEKSGDISGISQADKTTLYNLFKATGHKSYLNSSVEDNYQGFVQIQAQANAGTNNDWTLLQIVRVIDEQGANKFGVENTHVFEKKVVTWLTTPAGTKYLKDQEKVLAKQQEEAKAKAEAEKLAKELEGNQPPLPPDSAQYKPWELEKAKRVSQTWLDQHPWTAKEKRDLKHYTGSAYHEMNGYLRGINQGISDRSKTAIQGSKDGMRPTTEPILVQRGTGLNQFQSLGVGRGEGAVLWGITGKTFKDEGFLSTSAGGRAAFGGEAVLEIECPVGTPMAYVAPISNYPSENEMLLQAGMEYKVLNVRKEGGRFVVRLRVVNWPGKVN